MTMVLEKLEVTKFSEMDLHRPGPCEASGSAFATTACGLDFFLGVEQEKKHPNKLRTLFLLTPFATW